MLNKRYRISFPDTRDPGFIVTASSPQEALKKAKQREGTLRGFPHVTRVGSEKDRDQFGPPLTLGILRRNPEYGLYDISPTTTPQGYRLHFMNKEGKPPGRGVWQDLGLFRTLRGAKAALKKHAAEQLRRRK